MSEHEQASAVTKVAQDLRAILDLAATLDDQAVHKANDPLMPGGLSMVALAGVADPEAWEHRAQTAERLWWEREVLGSGKTREELQKVRPEVASDEDANWEPPLQTLLFWSHEWRVEHNRESDRRPTLASEAAFIRQCLDWAWENEPHFEDFAADVRRARVRLESVLYAGNRVERTRVPCIEVECERQPVLIRVYGHAAAADHYKCPCCKTRYTEQRFTFAKAELLASQGADRHVKMQDARDAIDRSERTFRKWLRFWYVRSYTDPLTGQVWVWWPDVREMDLNTPRRRKVA